MSVHFSVGIAMEVSSIALLLDKRNSFLEHRMYDDEDNDSGGAWCSCRQSQSDRLMTECGDKCHFLLVPW